MVYAPLTRHAKGLRLLSLDGGGVRGIMALEVLRELMLRVKKRKNLAEIPRPADYFELAGGTSTGGIMGIMLFRLRMSVDDTIAQYDKIAKDIFSHRVWGFNIEKVPFSGYINNGKLMFQGSRFDGASLAKAVDDVVEKYGLDENDKKLKGNAPLQHERGARMSKVTINLAARATSVAPTFFPEVEFTETKPGLVFWDGGLLNNNPIDQLWYTRFELVDCKEPAPPISCIISLGTGYTRPEKLGYWFRLVGVASKVMDFATNTNAKGKDFSRHMAHLNQRDEHNDTRYIRFNPYLHKDIGLDEYRRMDELKEMARKHMAEECHQEWVEKAVDAICPDEAA